MHQTIYFNNSGMTPLACDRHYLYKVVKGAVTQKSAELKLGTAFHKMVEGLQTHHSILNLAMGELAPPNRADLDPLHFNAICNLAIAARDRGLVRTDRYALREFYFEIDDTEKHQDELARCWPTTSPITSLSIVRCGTIDIIDYDEADNHLILDDWKTTRKKIDGDFFRDYDLKSQRKFYVTGIQDLAIHQPAYLLQKGFKPEWVEAARDGRIKFRYIFVSYVANEIITGDFKVFHESELERFRTLVSEKELYAAFIYLNPDKTTKSGETSGACYFCHFKGICALNDPHKEQERFEAWPLGFSPYDPHHLDPDKM